MSGIAVFYFFFFGGGGGGGNIVLSTSRVDEVETFSNL